MPKTLREPARSIPVIGAYDVVVLGGGPAGIAAAVSAARNKAKTLLIEQTGALGGMSTNGMVPVFAPLGNSDRPAIDGIFCEVLQRLGALGGIGDNTDPLKTWIPHDFEKLKHVYDQIVTQAGAEILFFTQFADLRRRGRTITHVIIQNKAGRQAIAAKAVIDATGDADAAARAGVRFDKGDENGRLQAVGMCYAATGIDLAAYQKFLDSLGHGEARVNWWLDRIKAGDLPAFPDTEYRGFGPVPIAPGLSGVNFGHLFKVDGTNPRDLSRAMVTGRAMINAFIEYARKNIPGMKNVRVAASAVLPGVRETRRIRARSRITLQDFKDARHHPDDIACYDFCIDVHNASLKARDIKKTLHDYHNLNLPPGKSYGIPFSCLLPRKFDNLAVAGRSLSADRQIHGSARNQPACFAMGQAAGTAAAMSAKSNIPLHQLNIRTLQSKLQKANVRLA